MRVCVKLFAVLRETVGTERMEIEVPPGTRVEGLFDSLADSDERLARFRGRMAFAVNGNLSRADRELEDGDEIALLPPVSGGGR